MSGRWWAIVALLSASCATYPSYTPWGEGDPIVDPALPTPDLTLEIPGLSNCTSTSDDQLRLESGAPVTILVHGCHASAGKFRALAEVFAAQGQRAICYSYDDRGDLWRSSGGLLKAVRELKEAAKVEDITVLGHSLGGLVARKAFIDARPDREPIDAGGRIRLVTVSSPLAGIAAADHCGSVAIAVISLGLTVGVCRLISVRKWHQITSASDFVGEPGNLGDNVYEYIKVVTDERGSSRRADGDRCLEDDYVFSVGEQYYQPIDDDPRVDNVEVLAGHVEIVGDTGVAPRKLIRVFQDLGVMASVYPLEHPHMQRLLTRLYELPASGYSELAP